MWVGCLALTYLRKCPKIHGRTKISLKEKGAPLQAGRKDEVGIHRCYEDGIS